MDFSNLFSGAKFEEKVTNNASSSLPFLMNLLNGGKLDNEAMLKMIAGNNPQIQSLLPLMKMFTQNKKIVPKQNAKKFDYIKIKDYHNV